MLDIQDDATTAGATNAWLQAATREQDAGSGAAARLDPPPAGLTGVEGGTVSAADQAASQQTPPYADPPSASHSQQRQSDADSARADSETQASVSGSQKGAEDALGQQGRAGGKVRAVDADYSVATAKAGRKSQVKSVKKSEAAQSATSSAAASISQASESQQASSDLGSQAGAGNAAAILPPKPKPGAPKARKAPQPTTQDVLWSGSQGQGAQGGPPAYPPAGPSPQAAPQRPAPQQPQVQGPSTRKPSVQSPSAQPTNLPIYKPAPSAVPLPANSAWAKKLDLQPVVAPKAAPLASPAPPPSQPPPTPPAAAAIPRPVPLQTPAVADRPSSAGSKGKSKKKRQGQGPPQQPSVAQPSPPAPSGSGQRGSAVKEVPATAKDSLPRASTSTVLTAPGLEQQASTSGGYRFPPPLHPNTNPLFPPPIYTHSPAVMPDTGSVYRT